jgi:hypothetical protein
MSDTARIERLVINDIWLLMDLVEGGDPLL